MRNLFVGMENVKKERQINVFVLIIIRNAKLLV
jgi:hypothetical protein